MKSLPDLRLPENISTTLGATGACAAGPSPPLKKGDQATETTKSMMRADDMPSRCAGRTKGRAMSRRYSIPTGEVDGIASGGQVDGKVVT